MRKTIDEIKRELSNTPKRDSFRLISKEEQLFYWGTQGHFLSFLPEEIEPTPKSKVLFRKKKSLKVSPLLIPTSFPNN